MLLTRCSLYWRLLWNHLVFWTFPTPQEDYYSRIARIHFEQRNYRKAISCFQKSARSQGHRDIPLTRYNSYYLGYCYLNLGDLRRAIEHFEEYLRLRKDDFETATVTGWCCGLVDKPEAALEWYLRALALQPSHPGVCVECARILADLGRREEALTRLEEARAAVHHSIEKRLVRAISSMVGGDLEGAIEVLKGVVGEADSSWNEVAVFQKEEAYVLLAKYQREAGDLRGAESSLESAVTRSPDDPWLINELAMEYADQGVRLERAFALIKRALNCQPENPVFLDTIGWILFKMGRREEAKAALERCLEVLPDYVSAREHCRVLSGEA